MRDLFAKEPERFGKMSASFESILLDYSKNIVTEETLALLEELISAAEVRKLFHSAPSAVSQTLTAPPLPMASRCDPSARSSATRPPPSPPPL